MSCDNSPRGRLEISEQCHSIHNPTCAASFAISWIADNRRFVGDCWRLLAIPKRAKLAISNGKYSDEKYEPSFLPSGMFVGTPEEAFDCAAQVYLQD